MAAQLSEAVVVAGERERLEHLLLDAARVVLPLGAAAAMSAVGNHGASAALAFLGLLIWLLGVCLLSFVPAADRFPQAAAFAGAAIANANAIAIVLGHLAARPPWK